MYSPTQQSRTRQTVEERDWSSSNHTYYYSKFELFDDSEQISRFYQYSIFLEKLSDQLGEEWDHQAHAFCAPHFTSRDIFLILLSIWFRHHPVINTISHQNQNKPFNSTFHQTYLDHFNEEILNQLRLKNPSLISNIQIPKVTAKAICMGFFLSANEIWTEMFQKQSQTPPKKFNIFQGMSKKLQQSFQPLMLVTEKITNLFGKKKVKPNHEMEVHHEEKNGKMFQNCYYEFKKTIDLEQQLVRKMSDFSLEDDKSQKINKKTISHQEFRQDPVEKSTLENFYHYLTKYLKINSPWKVANSFVTNILDMSQLETEDGTKIKILKPAQDFYHKLILVWLTITRQNKTKNIPFEEYLTKVRYSLGHAWKDNFVYPIKYFYSKVMGSWEEIVMETGKKQLTDEEIITILLKKIRVNMKMDWENKIKMQRKVKSQ